MAFKQLFFAATCSIGIATVAMAEAPLPGGSPTAALAPPPAQPYVDPQRVVDALPSSARWLYHLEHELLPFWTTPTALGNAGRYAFGDFPTYRCNDGSLFVDKDGLLANPDNPCVELVDPVPGIVWADRDYTRAKSRQVYAYGIAYHMTGNTEYLRYAKAGVDFLRQHALDPSGGAYSYQTLEGGAWGPASDQRRSQDLSYALTGVAFYYYLTRDPQVLEDIEAVKNHIWDRYYDPGMGLIKWVNEKSPDGDLPDQKELVAQLDQVYAYGLWLTPALPKELREQWQKDLVNLAHTMITQFYSPREGLFWGAITTAGIKKLGTDHTDFGHSVKTMWLIYQLGKWTGDLSLVEFGRVNAARILEVAYMEDTGEWARSVDGQGNFDKNKEWWAMCELDQVAATLALIDPAYARYLPTTYADYLEHMVDREHGGVWHWVDWETKKPDIRYPKQHSWKNALHSFEHALVAYMTTRQLHQQDIPLYYAFDVQPEDETVHPYFYLGKIKSTEPVNGGTKVIFSDLR